MTAIRAGKYPGGSKSSVLLPEKGVAMQRRRFCPQPPAFIGVLARNGLKQRQLNQIRDLRDCAPARELQRTRLIAVFGFQRQRQPRFIP
jgi:hypothetical protein